MHRLRASGKITAALVAEEKQRILRHVIISKVAVDAEGGEVGALALAPLAVEPAFQRLCSLCFLCDLCAFVLRFSLGKNLLQRGAHVGGHRGGPA